MSFKLFPGLENLSNENVSEEIGSGNWWKPN